MDRELSPHIQGLFLRLTSRQVHDYFKAVDGNQCNEGKSVVYKLGYKHYNIYVYIVCMYMHIYDSNIK